MLRPIALLAALAALPAAAQDEPTSGALQSFTVNQAQEGIEPPLTENEPVYFGMGTRSGTNARFQLSFKYRMFDRSLGWGRDQPWLRSDSTSPSCPERAAQVFEGRQV